MTTHEKLAQEAAQLLAHIREDTARADALDPDNPPARSSAQRRVESARRRLDAS
ncbi:hypothetical protein [Streptomyces sp. NPDC002215]|uniref:hypothetical protein n=1 Tax=Streptomyces sp. NPDC002215 TaxID=3154412 RepID=UPI0033240A58